MLSHAKFHKNLENLKKLAEMAQFAELYLLSQSVIAHAPVYGSCVRVDLYENFVGCQIIFNELKFQTLRSDHPFLRYT